jgi:DnaK suppressor protein
LRRLLARPTATLSLEAQQRREIKQKMYGDWFSYLLIKKMA